MLINKNEYNEIMKLQVDIMIRIDKSSFGENFGFTEAFDSQ